VLHAAERRGCQVPRDVSVVGFDDIDISRAASPRLTTVRQPLQEIGRMAVTSLMRVIEGQRAEALHVELATELVVRGSTGPAPSQAGARAPLATTDRPVDIGRLAHASGLIGPSATRGAAG
ncbi:MAG TPA: substrate-binding domain-containing protein, partial [Acidimicrobiales bacterium]|nr:substrate-binding domain-containing protein [Acidimicrobiales bacterium]